MNKSLRVLIVEDSADDAELLVRELGRGGYDVDYRRVETAATLFGGARTPGVGFDLLRLYHTRLQRHASAVHRARSRL